MTNSARAGIGVVVLIHGLAGCDDARPTFQTAPSAVTTSAEPSPVGTVLMRGTVSDTAFRQLPGATVEIISGPHAGMSTRANVNGEFSFTGQLDETTKFRATSDGHIESVRTLQPFCARCNPPWWIHFALDVPATSVDVVGNYTLTIEAASTCTMLPSEVRTRTFTATIPHQSIAPVPGGNAVVQVGGATVVAGWDAIGVGVSGDYVAFWLEVLLEQPAPARFIAFTGQASGIVGPSGTAITLPFAGSIDYCASTSGTAQYMQCRESQSSTRLGCTSADHRFVLRRR
jgi:hypothetical protein